MEKRYDLDDTWGIVCCSDDLLRWLKTLLIICYPYLIAIVSARHSGIN